MTFGHQERGMFEVFQKGKAVSTVIKHFDFGEKSFSEKELKRKLREWSEKHGIRYG